MSYNDLIGDVPPIIQEEYGEEETVAEFSAWEQDLKSVELEFLKTGKSGKSDKPGVLITNSGNYKYQLDRGSIRSSPKFGLSTPYRLDYLWEQCWTVPPCSFLHGRPEFGPTCTEFVYPGGWHFDNGSTSKNDDVLTEDGGLLHALPLAVHQKYCLMDK